MRRLVLRTERRTQLLDITAEVRQALEGQSGQAAVGFGPHTTAGIVLQASGEGATAVAADLEAALQRIVDEGWKWEHTEEGDRNPSAHVRSALTASSVAIRSKTASSPWVTSRRSSSASSTARASGRPTFR
jgi:secondary thiamine-phosphate synthase enzyme